MSSTFFPVVPRINKILAKRKSKRLKLKILTFFVTFGFIFFVLFLIGTAVAFGFFARDLPSPNKLSDKNFEQATKIYDRNGNLLYNVFDDQNRTLVTLDKIPADVKNATVAIEDKNFYKHKGFDPLGYVRALKQIIFEKQLQGGSTLTQQLVKNALLSSERTVTRKIKEFILSVQIERRFTKDEILQMYLNEVPYGGTAWGIEAASQEYFGKHVWELNLVESAILAGLPQKPSVYSPHGNNPLAYIDRTKDVLRRMREDGYITEEQEQKAAEQLPKVKFVRFGEGIKAPHFSIYVKNLLEEKYGSQLVQQGGLRVTTTLDLNLQNMAQKVVRDQVASERHLQVNNGAAVIENTKTGEILAWVGSKDYFAKDIPGQFDIVSQALRQPGSALKPFNYLVGFENGYTPATMFIDERTDFGGGYVPSNYCDCFNGPMSVRVALASSRNIPAVKMLAVNDVPEVIRKLNDFGITTLSVSGDYGLSLTLGGGAIKLIELTNAYAILGNLGKKVSPVVILKVTDSSGKIIEEFNPEKFKNSEGSRVTAPEHAYLINHILSDPTAKYLDYGSYWAHQLNFKSNLAVKTGTSEYRVDNWAFGYTPEFVIGTWVGNNDNSPMRGASGVTGAAPIFRGIAHALLDNRKVVNWERPENIVSAKVDAITGLKPKSGSATKTELFAKWQVPTQENDMIVEKRICTPTGLLANPSCEAAGLAVTKTYLVLYDPYLKIFKSGYRCKPCPPTQVDPNTYDSSSSGSFSLQITSPSDGATVGSTFTVKALVSSPNTVISVEFYLDGILKVDESAPYQATFSSVSSGNHEILVRAYDSSGDSVEKSIEVKVNPSGGPLD